MGVNGTKVVALHADPQLVEHLEKLLAAAKTGELRSCATVTVGPERDPQVFWCIDTPRDTHVFTAGVGDLHFRIHLRRLENSVPAETPGDDDTPA